jgi:hypothetical protein
MHFTFISTNNINTLTSQSSVCPAVCHPICERPKCQMQCDETPCAKCTVHCQKPVCSVRCPKVRAAPFFLHIAPVFTPYICCLSLTRVRMYNTHTHIKQDMCEKDNCPKCETVCQPAECHTKCVAPEPTCAPECEDVKCNWKVRSATPCEATPFRVAPYASYCNVM